MSLIKNKIITAVVIIGVLLMAIFALGFGSKQTTVNQPNGLETTQTTNPKVLSTNPSPLENTTIVPTQIIEVTFSHPIENAGEVKYRLDPIAEVVVTLSDDRKTVKFTPKSFFELGQGYTLFIMQDTKFDQDKRQDGDAIFHFKTIPYTGV